MPLGNRGGWAPRGWQNEITCRAGGVFWVVLPGQGQTCALQSARVNLIGAGWLRGGAAVPCHVGIWLPCSAVL